MRKTKRTALAASAASLALALAPPSFAQGQGKGNGKGGGPHSAQENRGNGGGNENRGNGNGNADRGNRGGPEVSARGNGNGNADRGGGNASRGDQNGNADRASGSRNDARSNGNGNANRGNASANRANGNANVSRGNGNGGGSAAIRTNGNRDRTSNVSYSGLSDLYEVRSQLIDGCPPGLASKRNGCLPPGQARQRYRNYDPGFFGLFGADRGDYYYSDGYLLRYRGDGLLGYLPLLGGALGIGNTWPSYYEPRPIPDYYSSYYGFDDPTDYRYADNAIYRVDPQSQVIQSVAALLTGDQFAVGSPMPSGYDVYNVPYGYRDQYYDTPQENYRYADGQIYQVDPTTQLVTAIIDLVL
ncbi:hypothetical protein [Qipengyuania atrilutea]|uniref:Uncharacterized protein n=1 Tax=Qipengyuania atrilutea TaxID=2744473 RepID=A0A850H2V8_9SPHN|nr:hypothetical protein [Actirhodobacter atriluteus]NVD44920.1 hypothetical protein [Actirhodobacter atriluteus]